MVTINSLHKDLIIVKELVYDKCGLSLTSIKLCSESKVYGACSFELNGIKIQHRVSKITPKKIGQFVTLWKRNKNGVTEPFDMSDDIDFIVITARSGNKLGQFVFPMPVLAKNGIITQNLKSGKRGIRVYPPWDNVTSKQAKHTQSWQIDYFYLINEDTSFNLEFLNKLNQLNQQIK